MRHQGISRIIAGFMAVIIAVFNPISVIASSQNNSESYNNYNVDSSVDENYDDEGYEEPVLEENNEDIGGSKEDDDDISIDADDDITEDTVEETVSYDEVLTNLYDDLSYDPSVSENTAVKEIIFLRDEYVKAYSMADHSIKACYYPEPVNYMDEAGRWETIDNRFH